MLFTPRILREIQFLGSGLRQTQSTHRPCAASSSGCPRNRWWSHTIVNWSDDLRFWKNESVCERWHQCRDGKLEEGATVRAPMKGKNATALLSLVDADITVSSTYSLRISYSFCCWTSLFSRLQMVVNRGREVSDIKNGSIHYGLYYKLKRRVG